ncbi:hypothetical protein [Streptomyces sp. NPDC002078]
MAEAAALVTELTAWRGGLGDHSIRHRGERDGGQVYPVTREADEADETVMRWTTPPHDIGRLPPAQMNSTSAVTAGGLGA